MATFEVPDTSITLHARWSAAKSKMVVSADFSYYPQGLDASLIPRFTEVDSVSEDVDLATYDALTNAQERAQLKLKITEKLEEGGAYTVVYV